MLRSLLLAAVLNVQPIDYQQCVPIHNQDLFPQKVIGGRAPVSGLV